jgi:hypothetical protein
MGCPTIDLSSSVATSQETVRGGVVMISTEVLAQFSRNRLDGEPVPEDLRILLPHRDELAARTGFRLEWAADWSPWTDPIALSEAEIRDPDITANLRAVEGVCRLIAFVAADEEEQLLGYWRGPAHREVTDSPLVVFDKDGQFHLCVASTFAEAILAREYGRPRFSKVRAWLRSLGIRISWENPGQLTIPFHKPTPKEHYRELVRRYRTDPLHEG